MSIWKKKKCDCFGDLNYVSILCVLKDQRIQRGRKSLLDYHLSTTFVNAANPSQIEAVNTRQ